MMTLLKNEAEKLNIEVTEEDVEAHREKLLKAAGGPEGFRQLLSRSNLDEDSFWDSFRDQILMDKFIDKKAGAEIAISDGEAKDYYQEHPTEFDVPETIHAQHILVKALVPEIKEEIQKENPEIGDKELIQKLQAKQEELKEKSEKLLAKVKKNPEQLGDLAKKHSDDNLSDQNGGDLGFLAKRYTDPAFWQAISATRPGNVYPEVVKSQFGYHVVKVLEHKEAHKQSFEEAKPDIVAMLGHEKKQRFLEGWLKDTEKNAEIEIEAAYKPEVGKTAEGNVTTPEEGAAETSEGKASKEQPAEEKTSKASGDEHEKKAS
jgi:parvulin-like peptidyl-prolyl isomerase